VTGKIVSTNSNTATQSGLGSASAGSGMLGGQQAQLQQAGLSSSVTNCGWYPYQTTPSYAYYWYPVGNAPKPTVTELIATYKKEFGKDWKQIFAQTVKVEAR
jgi:hypothetical protein